MHHTNRDRDIRPWKRAGLVADTSRSGSITALPVSIDTGVAEGAGRKSNPMTSAPSRRRIS